LFSATFLQLKTSGSYTRDFLMGFSGLTNKFSGKNTVPYSGLLFSEALPYKFTQNFSVCFAKKHAKLLINGFSFVGITATESARPEN
jgi:hypothetical protein